MASPTPPGKRKEIMIRLIHRSFALLFCMAACCGCMIAQSKTITLRMMDSKTGKLIETSSFLVSVNHDPAVHANWVVQNEDGTGKLTLPAAATLLSIHATYDNSMVTYVNCDGSAGKAGASESWYSIAEILATGISVPNSCGGHNGTAKHQLAAKPGELIFFVRKLNMREQYRQDYE